MLMDVKSILKVGHTPVLLIFMSNGTHLLNFAGHKVLCPVYVTIGNLSAKIRQMPGTQAVVMVTLLPIPIKNCSIPSKLLIEQRQTN